jgi:hypothetical protein
MLVEIAIRSQAALARAALELARADEAPVAVIHALPVPMPTLSQEAVATAAVWNELPRIVPVSLIQRPVA